MKTVKVAIAVIINSRNQVLLTQRFDPANPSVHLKWQLPGGGVEKGENASQACIREALEETGLTIRLQTQTPSIIHSVYEKTDYILHGFGAVAVSGTIDTQSDIETADAKWVDISDISSLKTLDSTIEMVKMCL